MFFVIHTNSGFIPIGNNVVISGFSNRRIIITESHHIMHSNNIRLHIANHNLDFVSHTVIHFANSTGASVTTIGRCRIIMQTNIIGSFASKSNSNAFLYRNSRFRQSQTNVTRCTNENHAMPF